MFVFVYIYIYVYTGMVGLVFFSRRAPVCSHFKVGALERLPEASDICEWALVTDPNSIFFGSFCTYGPSRCVCVCVFLYITGCAYIPKMYNASNKQGQASSCGSRSPRPEAVTTSTQSPRRANGLVQVAAWIPQESGP